MALIALAVLVSVTQWLFTQTAVRVDMHLLPAHARRRVQWLLAHSPSIYLGCAGTVVAVAFVQAAVGVG